MSELLIERLQVIEDAAYIRNERRAGDPDREPDETTVDDVTEAILRQTAQLEPLERWSRVKRDRDVCIRGLSNALRSIYKQG
jgi:hypothetical protein